MIKKKETSVDIYRFIRLILENKSIEQMNLSYVYTSYAGAIYKVVAPSLYCAVVTTELYSGDVAVRVEG